MKKAYFVILFVLLCFTAVNAEMKFEIGPRIGNLSFDDDKLGSGFAYGYQAAFYFNENHRIKVSYDMFEGDTFTDTERITYEYTSRTSNEPLVLYNEAPYTIYVYETSINSTSYYLNWNKKYETETKPLLCEYNYLFNFENWMISLGAGAGVAQNDITAEYYFNTLTPQTSEIATLLNSSISTSASVDDSFIYGLTGEITYNGYWENLTFSLEYVYIKGDADGEIVTRNVDTVTTEEFELDTTGYGLYLTVNYSF